MSEEREAVNDERLEELLAHHEIREILYRYCRAVDRRQYELLRTCYHPDATDDHGFYVGGIDGFIDQLEVGLAMYETTTHLLGNITVELHGPRARSEAYLVAFHRIPADDQPARDFIIGGRYVDDFEWRDDKWRIASRVCVVDWARIDPVPEADYAFLEAFRRGQPGDGDPVFLNAT